MYNLTIQNQNNSTKSVVEPTDTPRQTEAKSPKPSASPTALTFAQMQKAYGPCTVTPVIFYHHIQDLVTSKKKGQTALSTTPEFLKAHLAYIQQVGYNIITPSDLADFFNSEKQLPSKSIILSFDDGYEDFYTVAYPILKEFNAHATIFLPTGLVGNNDYLKWDQVSEMASSGLIYIANHTWSHHSISDIKSIDSEIGTAHSQLTDRSLNSAKSFAYPYGTYSYAAEVKLSNLGYSSAFTTQYGKILCKQKRFALPRIRVGNGSFSAYGL